ncbi:MAG: FkbM family methyltransferase [Phenylobacterium sp.]
MPEDKGIWTGTYEIDFASKLAAAVRPGDVTYDIGSWHGFFAGVMSAQGAREVHVFEPLPANVERIRQLLALNPERNIKLHACAVGEADAEMDLVVMPETSMAKLEASSFQKDAVGDTRVRVSVVSIDSMVAAGTLPPPSVIKIDVEGAEIFVLKGAMATIRDAKPQIFCEVHSSDLLAQCKGLFGSIGYGLEYLDADMGAARARDVFQIRAYPAT